MILANGRHLAEAEEATDDLFLGSDIHEIMEIVPTMPKVERLLGMLRGSEYGEDEAGSDTEMQVDNEVRSSLGMTVL